MESKVQEEEERQQNDESLIKKCFFEERLKQRTHLKTFAVKRKTGNPFTF